MDRRELIGLAKGEGAVDLLLTGGLLVDVLSGRVHPASVAIDKGFVVGLDAGYEARETIDLEGAYLAPGLIDAHIHLESSMLTVPEFARCAVPHGTTTVITDTHEIANVMGAAGVEYILDSARVTPLDVYIMLPSCVPATHLETSGAVLDADALARLKTLDHVIGLGELMNFPGTIAGDPEIMAKLALFEGMPVDGHAPGLSGKDLSAYVAAGPDSDHECFTAVEAEEKMQKGMYLLMRQGTSARNLLDLLPVTNASNNRRCCLCVDDLSPAHLLVKGHIDHLIRLAAGMGVSPMTAIQMATINTAERFGLKKVGAVAPGYRADIAVFNNLDELLVKMVVKDGKVVASGGRPLFEPGKAPVAGSTFHVKDFNASRLRLVAEGQAHVIGVIPGQLVTESLLEDVGSEGGLLQPDTARDILKIAVVERHKGTGNVGVAMVKGFGLKSGALASSVAHDSHNIVAVGCSDEEIVTAVEHVIEMGGGQVVVDGAHVIASLPLPIAGLMSPMPAQEVALSVDDLNKKASSIGCGISDPFMTMSFLALPVIPSLKLTDKGLVDVDRFEII